MDMAELRLSYELDPSGCGGLSASVISKGFSGETSWGVTKDEILPFIDALSKYPLEGSAKLSLGELRYGPVITVVIAPSNSRGGLKVHVELYYDGDRELFVTTNLYTDYSGIEPFRAALLSAVRFGGEAILQGGSDRDY